MRTVSGVVPHPSPLIVTRAPSGSVMTTNPEGPGARDTGGAFLAGRGALEIGDALATGRVGAAGAAARIGAFTTGVPSTTTCDSGACASSRDVEAALSDSVPGGGPWPHSHIVSRETPADVTAAVKIDDTRSL